MGTIETTLTFEEFAENLAEIVERVADSRERVLVEASNGTRVQLLAVPSQSAPVVPSRANGSAENFINGERQVYLDSPSEPLVERNVDEVADEIFANERDGVVFHASIEGFEQIHDALVTRMSAKHEFLKYMNRGGVEIEFQFERYPPTDPSLEKSERWKSFLATFGTMTDEEADELENYIDEGRKIPRREYDFS